MDEIRIYPDSILRKKAQPVENIDGKVKEIADRMAKVMYANKGVGLAAPQIGILSRILIVDLWRGKKGFDQP
ncbi:MAG: peptide deformylase [Thermodesulfobacteriota bacterium]